MTWTESLPDTWRRTRAVLVDDSFPSDNNVLTPTALKRIDLKTIVLLYPAARRRSKTTFAEACSPLVWPTARPRPSDHRRAIAGSALGARPTSMFQFQGIHLHHSIADPAQHVTSTPRPARVTHMLSQSRLVLINLLHLELLLVVLEVVLDLVQVLGTHARARCALHVAARVVGARTAEAAHCFV